MESNKIAPTRCSTRHVHLNNVLFITTRIYSNWYRWLYIACICNGIRIDCHFPSISRSAKWRCSNSEIMRALNAFLIATVESSFLSSNIVASNSKNVHLNHFNRSQLNISDSKVFVSLFWLRQKLKTKHNAVNASQWNLFYIFGIRIQKVNSIDSKNKKRKSQLAQILCLPYKFIDTIFLLSNQTD